VIINPENESSALLDTPGTTTKRVEHSLGLSWEGGYFKMVKKQKLKKLIKEFGRLAHELDCTVIFGGKNNG
jgi:hypothetical protein